MKNTSLNKSAAPHSQKKATDPVLIVDDDPMILSALEATLTYENYPLLKADTGKKAVTLLQENTISMIVCDLKLPDLHGMEVLKQAKELQPDAIRIVLTGLNDLEIVTDLINVVNVSQFILKPWDTSMLLQTIQTSMEQYQLVQENARLQELTIEQNKKLEHSHANLQSELHLGGKIHQLLLMEEVPKQIQGLKVEATTTPSREIDGDFFGFYQPSGELLDVVIADVMGKGLPAALVGTAVKTQLTRFAIPFTPWQSFTKEKGWEKMILSPAKIMERVQKETAKTLIDLEYFVSLVYGRFDLSRNTLTFVDCGSVKPLHYHAKTRTITELKGENYPLGFFDQQIYQSQTITYETGDLFVFYSDGVSEAKNAEGELYGTKRLIHFLQKNAHLSQDSITKGIEHELTEFTGSNIFDDDVTVIVIKVEHTAEFTSSNNVQTTQFKSDLSQLAAVRDFVHRVCLESPGDSERLSQMMQLLIDEAFANIVIHGHENPNGIIQISAYNAEKELVLEVSDQGYPFQPELIEEPNYTGQKSGGFGLYIIKEIADRVIYIPKDAPDGWNHLRIIKPFIQEANHMQFQHEQIEDILQIKPIGESLDAKEAPNFKKSIQELITKNNAKHVLLDLSDLQFIDSSGLGCFLSVLRLLNSRGGELKISGMTKPIRTVFELVCMHKVFEIYNNKEDAIHSFALAKS